MNIMNFGFSGGDAASRPGTGTVPASGEGMFGDTLPFRLQLASSTAKLAAVDGMAAPVDGVVSPFTGLDGLELSELPQRVSFAGVDGEAAEQPNMETIESSELAPTLALLAPIVDAPTRDAVAITGGQAGVRVASSAPAMTADTGDAGPEAQLAPNAGTTEEVLADPEGDVAAMLRRVRATAAADRASAQPTASTGDRAPTARSADALPVEIAPRLDQAQNFVAQTRAAAPELARVRPTAASTVSLASDASTSSSDTSPTSTTETADPRIAAMAISDLRIGANMRQPGDLTTSRVRASAAAERSTAGAEPVDAEYEIDMAVAETVTVEDTPLPRPVTAPAAEMRAGQVAPFAANLAAASGADQTATETATRTDTTQDIPLDQRFGERLGAMVGAAMGNATLKDGMLRLQVTPDHLGPIEIEMDTTGASERLQITVENEAVRQAVAQAQARIEQELRQAGAKLASVDVALRDSGADAQGNSQTNSQGDADARRPGSTTPHDTGLTGTDGSAPIDDRIAPRPGQPGNILYA